MISAHVLHNGGIEMYERIEQQFNIIAKSGLYKINGEEMAGAKLCEALIALCDAINETETDEFVWTTVGEHGEFSLDCLLVGAYWALSEWHGGQSSIEYAALCAIGSIYSPGCESAPDTEEGNDDDTPEAYVYRTIGALFEKENPPKP